MRLYAMTRIAGLLFMLVCITACTKSVLRYQAHGTLMRIDNQGCTCCGGIILKIDRDTTDYRVDSIGWQGIDMLLNLDLPQRIHFDYTRNRICDSTVFLTLNNFETESRR
jgi:hypothetical protein